MRKFKENLLLITLFVPPFFAKSCFSEIKTRYYRIHAKAVGCRETKPAMARWKIHSLAGSSQAHPGFGR